MNHELWLDLVAYKRRRLLAKKTLDESWMSIIVKMNPDGKDDDSGLTEKLQQVAST